MRKGFFASVAALTAGANVALAQLGSAGPPGSGGPVPYAVPQAGGMPPGGAPQGFYGGPGGSPAGSGGIPPAAEMPLYGEVPGPDSQHPMNPGCAPPTTHYPGQVHKAAGGPDCWWFNIEENVWTIRSMPVTTPLLTRGPLAGGGLLGAQDTIVALGNEDLERHLYMSAIRASGGWWDCAHKWGFELSGFLTEWKPQVFEQDPGTLLIARPVTFTTDNVTFTPNAFVVGAAGLFPGHFRESTEFHMGGAEGNLLYSLINCDMIKADILVGGRYLDMTENLDLASISLLPNVPRPDLGPITSTVTDTFRTHNQWSGGQVGLDTEFRCGRLFLDLTGKYGYGSMHERLLISGTTDTTVNGITTTQQGGLLALPTNSAVVSQNKGAYLVEGTGVIGWQWTQRISTYVGGNLLYVQRLWRPGSQIDPVVNPTFVPTTNGQFGPPGGVTRPQPTFKENDFWIGGGTVGLSIRF
jgi:hypothetical protein